MTEFFHALLHEHSLHKIMIGTVLIGINSGLLGTFTFLRKQSLLGDAISHAALPGITLMFLITQSQHPLILFLGGFIAGILGTLFVWMITHYTRLKKDAALGIVLSVFFGLGLVLLTVVQKRPVVGQAFLHRFLFGDASTLLSSDIFYIAIITTFVILTTILSWKEFKFITFDKDYASVVGFPAKKIELLFIVLLVTSLVLGLQMVGVILMSALLIASAVAARQWTNTLEIMALLSAFFGGSACALGSLASFSADRLPTGPAIVLAASLIVIFSFALTRVWAWQKRKGIL